MIKLISWNVNGLRACINKGFNDYFKNTGAQIFCLQEIKLQKDQLHIDTEGYGQFWNFAEKKGYSGTAVFTAIKPLSAQYGIGIKDHDNEGRVITLEYDDFFLVNVYTPNSKRGLLRLDYRMKWEDDFRSFLKRLELKKPVIVCGDMNVAHKEIDLKNPSSNKNNAGFTVQERDKFTELMDSGFIDTYRHFFPDQKNAYTWWSNMFNAREKNVGWRIDYFCISEILVERLESVAIHSNVYGSDHCPIELVIK